MARVSLILVTWNSARFLPRCLDGIAQQSFRDLELIAVDNGSADDSVAIVRARFPDATILQNTANEGFSRAVNQGIARASGDCCTGTSAIHTSRGHCCVSRAEGAA